MSNPKLQTVKQFVAENPAFTDGGVRFQIFNEDKNGLKEAKAIIRVGRRVLIDTERYFAWIYSQNDLLGEDGQGDVAADKRRRKRSSQSRAEASA